MGNMLRLFVGAGLVAFAILVIAIGLARNTAALLAPVHLILFVVLIAGYLLPTALALYRGCVATGWIAAINILLGWTVFGWVIALGWAAGGRINAAPPSIPAPPVQPIPGH